MKFIRGKFKFLVLFYTPIYLLGVALTYLFPEQLLTALRVLLPIFFLIVIYLAFSRAGKHRFALESKPRPNFWQKLALWWCLELAIGSILLMLFSISLIGETAETQIAVLQSAKQLYLYSALFPWSLYLILGLAFAYFGRQNNLALIRSSLWPLYPKQLNNIPGLGIDFSIKQATLTAGALAISLSMGFVIHSLCTILTIQSPFNHSMVTLLGSMLVFMILASPFWRRLTRYLWLQRYPLAFFLTIYVILALSAYMLSGLVVKVILSYYLHISAIPPNKINFSWLANQPVTKSLLLILLWQLLGAPWFATLFAKLARGFTVRAVIFQALSLPILMTITVLMFKHFNFNLNLPLLALGMVIVSLGFAVFFYRLPENLQLVQLSYKTPSPGSNLQASRTFMFSVSSLLVIYFLINTGPLVLYASGVLIPVVLILFGACLSLLISLK